jgi:hypothetical protein
MPKRVYEINPFHGGINSKDDQRDILETQLVEALNVKADSKGTLKLIGNLVSGGSDWASTANSSSGVHPGYGFFRFSSDANFSGASGTDDNNTDYLIAYSEQTNKLYWNHGLAHITINGGLTDNSANVTVSSTTGITVGMEVVGTNVPADTTVASITNSTVFVMSNNADIPGWGGSPVTVSLNISAWAEVVDLSSPWATDGASGGGKPTFSYANGAIRVSDANFNNTTNPNYWLGYIKRHNFKGCTGADNIAAWHANKAELTTPTSGPNIKTSLMSASGDATADDITWVVSTARLNTTEIHNYSMADNYDKWWTSSSSGDNIFVAQNQLFENPYTYINRTIDLGYSPDLSGDNVFSGSGYLGIGTTMQNGSANNQYFSSSFSFPTDGSVYMTVKLKDQKSFDAWNGGYAASSETTVIFRNLKIQMFNSANPLDSDDYISYTIPASRISLNDTDWFVLELPYDEADSNDLDNNTINLIKWSWDVTVEKSGSDSLDTTIVALSVCDVRTGDKGQQGTDLLGNRKFAYSYTYDDKRSESLLREIGTVNLGTKTDGYATLFQAGVKTFANKRITGAVLYAFEEDTPYMVAELDFVKGLRGSWDTEWPGTADTTTQFSTVDSSTTSGSTVVYNDTIPMVESYQARNGFSHKQDSIDARYKSIVITNNKAYVGNVYIDGVHYPDRMIKSQTFDYDAFPEEGRSIEVVKQDGDSIVTLAAYADRLFQYKNNKLHIINITSDQEFLEDSHTGLGVKYPYWVVEMSTGIAWFNENGAYYFDGKQINNVTNGLLEDETWKTHVSDAGNKAQIFYIPKQDKIMIVGGTNGADVYEYTIHTGGWTRASGVFENTNYTNYVLDIDNTVKTFKPADGKWYTWSDTATTAKSDYEVITGDLVFDSSAVRKKIYSVHVTHKGLGAAKSIKCYGRADRAGTWTELGQLDNYTDFTVQEFDVSGVNNARSYQVRLKHYDSDSGVGVSNIPVGFEVNDINVVYRSKNVR